MEVTYKNDMIKRIQNQITRDLGCGLVIDEIKLQPSDWYKLRDQIQDVRGEDFTGVFTGSVLSVGRSAQNYAVRIIMDDERRDLS